MIKKLLIIDDTYADRYLCEVVARKSGLVENITQVTCTKDALTLFEAEGATFDLVFLDVNMPCVNGIHFLKDLEKIIVETGVCMQVVVLSSTNREDEINTALSYPFVNRFCEKPITASKFIDICDELSSLN